MTDEKTPAPTDTSTTPRALRDRRITPPGVLPRRLQTWLMAGLAAVIVLIILITGHTQPPLPASGGARAPEVALAPADHIRGYQQQLAEEDARQRDAATRSSAPATRPTTATPGATSASRASEPSQAAQSLFADNVVVSHRPTGQQPSVSNAGTRGAAPAALSPPLGLDNELASLERALASAATPRGLDSAARPPAPAMPADVSPVALPPTKAERPTASTAEDRTTARDERPAGGPRRRLFEGTVIETVLLTRLNGTLAGPVTCLVTTPVYSSDRQHVLIPAGARVLGAASPVQAWGDSRLAVSFHRLLMPDGHTYSLDLFTGLDAVGEAGLTESVNHHYLQVFGASLAIGALSGLAQYNTRVGADAAAFSDQYRQAAGASLASSTSRILDRYLNVLPTITIREGYRINVYLTNDFDLPVYAAAAAEGEIR